VLILGDVVFHLQPLTARRGLSEPFRFGHGPPLPDGDAFQRFVAGLPRLNPPCDRRGARSP
jgi:hypothetical protein